MKWKIENIVMSVIKQYTNLQINQILALNNPYGIEMPFKQTK